MSAEIQTSRYQDALVLTLSNPEVKNALHPDMLTAAIEALSAVECDDSIRVVILTGANHFFCAGDNLQQLLENRAKDKSVQADAIDSLHNLIETLCNYPKPVIAAVDGAAAGAGFALALACDLIVAGASARFLMPYAKVGLTPDGGGSWFLLQALPRQLASEILMEGKPVSAQKLHAMGIVNKVVDDGMALDAAIVWAGELATNSPNAIERIKSLLREAWANSLAQQCEIEKHNFVESLHHRDAQEGISAFLSKRIPEYK
ncbi:MAG: enoyl-CoA hydratase [Oxalobacteraceae bacterium]